MSCFSRKQPTNRKGLYRHRSNKRCIRSGDRRLYRYQNGQGTITSIDGDFRLSNVYIGDVLTVSYVGFQTQNIVFNGQSKLNITLSESATELDQVVVTALGIKRSEKALSYNVQQLSSDDITTVKDPNFMNSLNGKVAGVTINSSASGAGSAARVVMRGVKSITKSNNALYVIDGIPMFNVVNESSDTGITADQPGSDAVADINPEDIEIHQYVDRARSRSTLW